jgi:predicted transcriptional regulator
MEQQIQAALADEPVRGRRIAAGLTQRQLARAADCSLPSVANLEAGLLPQRSVVVPRILCALDAAERAAVAPINDESPAGKARLSSKPAGTGRNAPPV